jgi:rRNA maturation endonuclease Nob1
MNKKLTRTRFDLANLDDRPDLDIDYIRNEIIDRIKHLTIDCPECENIIHSDDQYQCGTCGGGATIYVMDWVKNNLNEEKTYKNKI